MEYIIEKYTREGELSILGRAAQIAKLNVLSVYNGGSIFVYNDFGLNSKQREFKKTALQLIEGHINDGMYSSYRYTDRDIQDARDFIKKITPNTRKTPK